MMSESYLYLGLLLLNLFEQEIRLNSIIRNKKQLYCMLIELIQYINYISMKASIFSFNTKEQNQELSYQSSASEK